MLDLGRLILISNLAGKRREAGPNKSKAEGSISGHMKSGDS